MARPLLLVTGIAEGLGAGIAAAFARAGHDVLGLPTRAVPGPPAGHPSRGLYRQRRNSPVVGIAQEPIWELWHGPG